MHLNKQFGGYQSAVTIAGATAVVSFPPHFHAAFESEIQRPELALQHVDDRLGPRAVFWSLINKINLLMGQCRRELRVDWDNNGAVYTVQLV